MKEAGGGEADQQDWEKNLLHWIEL
jgi:hypothetical protein